MSGTSFICGLRTPVWSFPDRDFTGRNLAISNNARVLDIDLNLIDTVVLSHGHYDHSGGLQSLLASKKNFTLHGHPDDLYLPDIIFPIVIPAQAGIQKTGKIRLFTIASNLIIACFHQGDRGACSLGFKVSEVQGSAIVQADRYWKLCPFANIGSAAVPT